MKRRFHILIVLLLILSLELRAQPPETIYLGNVVASEYVINGSYGPLNIGFNFNYFGTTYTQFYVNTKGQILFGAGSIDGAEVLIPSASAPNNFIAAFWDDLVISSSGNILYTTVGAAPNRKLIVQFRNMGFNPFPVFMGTFSIILYETTNVIQIQYRQIVDNNSTKAHGESATIGIENSDGTLGVQYSYHNPTAVSTGQAISFTPPWPAYTVNSNAVYDGVYLTTNLTLPEPGIPILLSPPQNAVIGSDYTFEWSDAPYAASYSLKISTFSDLSGATSYNAGSNLTYNVTGLTLGNTYYWGVFPSNATGITWCEIKKFTTSATPPLAAVPQTVYVEQGQEKTIKLNYTGGDASAKSAIITVLPTQGQLYQYNAGVKGALISTVPATVTDAGINVIYLANGTSGNGVGNFSYQMHDDTGYSTDALITVNVSPPGIPNLLCTAKNTNIELQFDRPMADPTGKQSQFTATVNSSPAPISSLSLKTGDNYSIIVILTTPLAGGETVLISYTAGDIASAQGGWLASFTDQSVSLIAQTITFSQSLAKKYSDSPFTLTATASSGLVMTYSSSNLGVATIAGSVATFHALGSSDITARQAGNGTWAPAKYTRALTVAKGDQTISFSVLPVKTFGDVDFDPGATASSALSVSYASDNSAVATIVSGKIHIVGAGSAVITASQTGNSLWNSAADVPRTLTVNKANQTISFGVLPLKTYGDADFTPTVSASSGLSVSLASDNPSVATIVSGIIHIVGAGTAVITASQAGNINFNAAVDVPQTLTVGKVTLTATADNKTKIYGESNPPLTISYSGFVNGENASVLDVTLPVAATTADATTGVGAVAITVSGGVDNNYTYIYVSGTLTISKATLTVTAEDKTRVYGVPNPPLTVTYSGFVNSENASVIDTEPVASTTAGPTTNAGTVPITVSGGSDNNYSFTYVSGTLTITKATATITLGSLSTTYSGLPHAATATTTPPGLTVDFTYDGSATVPVNAGSFAVIATINDINYQGTASGTLSINKATLTATANDKTRIYGESNPPLTISYSGFVNGENASVLDATLPVAATTADATTNVGTVAITVSGGVDNNYTYIYVSGTLTISKATLTITADDKTRVYGVSNPPLTVSYSGFVNSENASVIDTEPVASTTAGPTTNAGTVPITVSGGSDNNYSFTYVSGTLTITKATAIVTLGSLSSTYSGLPHAATATTNPSGLTVDFSYDGSVTVPINAGSYAVIATINDNNYQGTNSGTLTINKATLTATADDKTKLYGESNPTLTISYSGFVNGENASVLDVTLPVAATTADATTGVGAVAITVSGGVDNNYTYIYLSGTLTISKATLTVTADDKTRVYGDPNPPLTVTYSGFVNSENTSVIDIEPVASTTAGPTTNAGTVPITVSGGSYNNYSFTYVSGTLTITKATATVTLGTLSSTYSGLPHAATATTTPPGLTVDFTYDGSATVPVNAGSYAVIATINDINYQGTNSGNLTINKASLTFTVDNKSRSYLAANPVLTFTISGFVNSETQSVLDALPFIQTTASQNTPAGAYAIILSGGNDNNYYYNLEEGILLITKIPQVITFSGVPEKMLVEDAYTLVATSSSGLPLLFESMDPAVATVTEDILTGISKGNVQIRAYQPGDQNYDAANALVTVEIYSTHKDVMHLFTPNNDGFNDYWELPDLATWGKCDVKVYNRWGKLVFADANYNNLWDGTSDGAPLPEGAYYYVIKTENAGTIKGTLNIVR